MTTRLSRRKQRRLATKLLRIQMWRGNSAALTLAAALGLEITP